MEPWVNNLADDLQSMSFNSTTTTDTDTNRITNFGSETTWTTAASASAPVKPRSTPFGDPRWDAIRRARSESPSGHITLTDLRFLHRLGAGDIGSVFMAELKSSAGDVVSKPDDEREMV